MSYQTKTTFQRHLGNRHTMMASLFQLNESNGINEVKFFVSSTISTVAMFITNKAKKYESLQFGGKLRLPPLFCGHKLPPTIAKTSSIWSFSAYFFRELDKIQTFKLLFSVHHNFLIRQNSIAARNGTNIAQIYSVLVLSMWANIGKELQ